jgi:mannose-6-phosphate isomerase-like protein (cupin superfamily)
MIIRHEAVGAFDFEGLRIRDYTAGLGGRSSLAVIQVPPGARHREAWSSRSEKYYYVTEGVVRFRVEGEERDLEAGDFCLVRQGQRFAYENTAQRPALLVLVHTPAYDAAGEHFTDENSH